MFVIRSLAEQDRTSFRSAQSELDAYFRTQVTQDVRRRITNCFVALDEASNQIAGFYTIAAASIALSDLPPALRKKLPRYPSIPAIRVGRLAVDVRFRGKGLGGALLADALARGLRADAAAYAVLVDAKDDAAAAFYEHHGFQRFLADPWTLFLPLATVAKADSASRRGR